MEKSHPRGSSSVLHRIQGKKRLDFQLLDYCSFIVEMSKLWQGINTDKGVYLFFPSRPAAQVVDPEAHMPGAQLFLGQHLLGRHHMSEELGRRNRFLEAITLGPSQPGIWVSDSAMFWAQAADRMGGHAQNWNLPWISAGCIFCHLPTVPPTHHLIYSPIRNKGRKVQPSMVYTPKTSLCLMSNKNLNCSVPYILFNLIL